ncbi:ethanolamine utilization protein EutH [Synergistes jonesii]|uniref:Ethanolamine utilization protein EutH n=1 Tax=Synergistes jonesii TaxID=2754 RepID=A0A073ITC4_9BACT|nr:ethanolamine utilization protein EutH [Synergistes jonesii]KEJ92736.1 ethanolamine utilization protein EutH [Synergistes jonesii]OFB62122.1 ethanolamine utilization protein EutH [Synergistes jonesii]OFB63771.1 ethanolamine utilization protein EutH [Synergistes jonesii]OFB65176.1 ethanolamine utilization protein EutH [Synergistes jonesii]OFB68319.1 ethanolamine utilization protein EutH [Synergistes jonesii]
MFQELIDNLCNTKVFTESFGAWVSNLSINSVIVFIMTIFMIVGAIDKIRGNKLGYGEEFDNGFNAMGPLAIAMAGVVAAAPVLAIMLKPIIVPLYSLVGADASMFATTLLACDMGGYPLAMQLAADKAVGNFSGLILGTMMGPTIVFTIPVALSIIKPEDRPYLGAGTLAGLITIPLGCIAGGLVMNMTPYKISMGTILVNLIPVIIVAGLICIGLWFATDAMIRGFNKFGTAVTILITIFTAIAVFEYLTGIRFPLFDIMVDPEKNDGVVPLESGLLVCGQIAIVLIGAFPMVKWITRTFGKALEKVGGALGMNETGSAGMVANLANNIAMFNILGDMNPKGKLLNVAFAVSAAFVFGDHLGFTAGNNPDMIFPVVVGKLVAGITAVVLASFLSPKLLSKIESAKK